MGSPRKAANSHHKKTPTTHHATPSATAPASHKSKSASTSSSTRAHFHKKKFYLDLKGNNVKGPTVRQLFEDIQALGGRVEQFFSKEIDVVISDAPEWKLKNPSSSPQIVSPGTPASLPALANSPWSPVNAAAAAAAGHKGAPVARSRVETILERARQQSKGTSDVIESASRHGIKVWALHKIQDFLERLKAKFGPLKRPGTRDSQQQQQTNTGHHTRSQSAEANVKAWQPPKQLSAPYLKFEITSCAYRPVAQEFKPGKFPKLYYTGKAGTSPFLLPEYTLGESDSRKFKEATNRGKKRTRSPSKQPTPTVTPAASAASTAQQPATKTTTSTSSKPAKKQPGFCEICDVSFSDLQPHLDCSGHKTCVNVEPLWKKLDLCIGLVNCCSDDSVHDLSDGRS